MTSDDGDYVARIERLTRRTQGPEAAAPASPHAGTASDRHAPTDLQADPADHGLGPLHPRASRRHAPPEERCMVTVKVKRSRWVRLLAGIGLFLMGNVISMLYIGLSGATERDAGFDVLFTLTWIAPFVVWFALRHRKLGQTEIKGYPLHTLAVMDLGLGEPCVTLRVPEEDSIVVDTVWLANGQDAEQAEVCAHEDLIIEIDTLLIRANALSLPAGETSHGRSALLAFQQALAASLYVPTERLAILSPTVSDNFEDGMASSVDYAEVILKGGLRMDTDAVCDAISSAMYTVRQHYSVELDP